MSPFIPRTAIAASLLALDRQPLVENLPSEAWHDNNSAIVVDYRGGGSSSEEDFFPIVSLLIAGSLVVAFHLQSHIHKWTLFPSSLSEDTTLATILQQPYRLWTCHWIQLDEIHFFRTIVDCLTHGVLCERTLGSVKFLEANLWALHATSVCGVLVLLLLKNKSSQLSLTHAQGVGFFTLVYFWMGLCLCLEETPWWHRLWCFLGIFVANVWMANKERGTLHHWIGVVNGLVYYAVWKKCFQGGNQQAMQKKIV